MDFIIAAICGLAGVLVTFIFIPHLKDEDLLEEDVKFKNYLIDNGWKGKFGIQEYDEEEDLEGSSEDSSDGEIVKNNTKMMWKSGCIEIIDLNKPLSSACQLYLMY